MIRVPRDFKPLLDDLSAAVARPQTARRLILFFAAAVLVVGDVYGKARHRDAVRSSHSHTVFRYGHKWIVLAVVVKLPYTNRPFALPILVALYRDLYRDKKTCLSERRRHKTAAEIMCGLLAVLMHWFPERKIVFAGDNAYGTNGRPPVKGRSLPRPKAVAKSGKGGKKMRVRWYGGGWRNANVFTGVGCWCKSGKGIVEIRWVYVIDLDGTHREECFFSTDPSMSPEAIIEMYGGR